MTGVDINHGDYVLVRKQETAENTDIVVAALGEEATLTGFFSSPRIKSTAVSSWHQIRPGAGKVIGIVKPLKDEAGW